MREYFLGVHTQDCPPAPDDLRTDHLYLQGRRQNKGGGVQTKGGLPRKKVTNRRFPVQLTLSREWKYAIDARKYLGAGSPAQLIDDHQAGLCGGGQDGGGLRELLQKGAASLHEALITRLCSKARNEVLDLESSKPVCKWRWKWKCQRAPPEMCCTLG